MASKKNIAADPAESTKAKAATAEVKKKDRKKNGKPGLIARAKSYFKAVRQELKRVVWPDRSDLVKYTVAVVAMLVFFGVLIALVDAVIVPALYAFSGLR
jgi:preprotein translocase subunit SecE